MMIELKNISFKYSSEASDYALDDVSLTIESGEWVAIIGHNGSGKSTTAKIMDGLIKAENGDVLIDGTIMTPDNVWELRKRIGMVFQNPDNQFVGSTVEDDVAFGLENQGIPRDEMLIRVNQALERVQMADYKTKEPARLSGGQKQRVAIAGVIALAPNIIILDEATSMLDPKGRQEVIKIVQQIKAEKNLTVVSITHDIDEAALADKIIVMKQGKVLTTGTPTEIFAKGQDLIELGLDVPLTEKIKASLAKVGIELPKQYLTEEEMVAFLWQLKSKK
ncbi:MULTISPECIES: energy-coupling factor ABC transporter ATP-binding protein [unclassified Enterococcus]|uniref:energy-coupling factor ABC transporter ATP-binding protein n=1 Tax=unclassified Enterococcus TaxID=2608891 RepID=UPI0015525D1D|nr:MULTISPECIES: energy-coupling factor ABC transporter ATP-binding protein [unclassified Enterococcus]MBS7577080.1 energy-coupling factor ABC transporter ATP-binding protein [Enterococcus sp. MMGLQ5-2]MBS7584473.1 energy-coupling factor ABC transporter ATP-binding protein [Enterococcus sp. MMGLQ5-1]NPD12328.1 energy-coupling factor ABC transporter ATP-binding protein [Enterococcus sp. MMGLQ5-1]NPD36914.1 energy-coupling factor ABC transporter ATP-binding protein [Enterococcus sp. MMGLQ5-2]